MFKKNDVVYIIENHQFINSGMIYDIISEINKLTDYFFEEHPLFRKFKTGILNGKNIYIVDHDFNGGRAGYFSCSLRKKK